MRAKFKIKLRDPKRIQVQYLKKMYLPNSPLILTFLVSATGTLLHGILTTTYVRITIPVYELFFVLLQTFFLSRKIINKKIAVLTR